MTPAALWTFASQRLVQVAEVDYPRILRRRRTVRNAPLFRTVAPALRWIDTRTFDRFLVLVSITGAELNDCARSDARQIPVIAALNPRWRRAYAAGITRPHRANDAGTVRFVCGYRDAVRLAILRTSDTAAWWQSTQYSIAFHIRAQVWAAQANGQARPWPKRARPHHACSRSRSCTPWGGQFLTPVVGARVPESFAQPQRSRARRTRFFWGMTRASAICY